VLWKYMTIGGNNMFEIIYWAIGLIILLIIEVIGIIKVKEAIDKEFDDE